MRGFTLVEMIIYIALLGVLMTGSVLMAYQIVQSASNVTSKNTVQEEGNFVMSKISWALAGASSITVSANELVVTRYDGNTVDIKLNAPAVDLKEGAGSFLPVTTSNVTVTGLTFTDIPAVGTAPRGVTAILTLNTNLDFSVTKYLRK